MPSSKKPGLVSAAASVPLPNSTRLSHNNEPWAASCVVGGLQVLRSLARFLRAKAGGGCTWALHAEPSSDMCAEHSRPRLIRLDVQLLGHGRCAGRSRSPPSLRPRDVDHAAAMPADHSPRCHRAASFAWWLLTRGCTPPRACAVAGGSYRVGPWNGVVFIKRVLRSPLHSPLPLPTG